MVQKQEAYLGDSGGDRPKRDSEKETYMHNNTRRYTAATGLLVGDV